MAKKNQPECSPAIQLLGLVFSASQSNGLSSWERLNNSMRQALTLSIGSGMAFHEDDFKQIEASFRPGYWIGDAEWVYSLAVSVDNKDAILAFEQWKNRSPIIADDVAPIDNQFNQLTNSRIRCRLHVGAEMEWEGYRIKVTKFKDVEYGSEPASVAMACSYKRLSKPDKFGAKVERRFRITREDVVQRRIDVAYAKTVSTWLLANQEKYPKEVKAFRDSVWKVAPSGVISKAKLEKLFDKFLASIGENHNSNMK